jgi:hypothetical protein
MKYAWIERNRHLWPITWACEVKGLSRAARAMGRSLAWSALHERHPAVHGAADACSKMAQVVVAWAYSFPSGPTILASDVAT